MIAGDDLAAFDGGEILDAAHFLEDELSVFDHFFEKACTAEIGDLAFDLV